jgi:hypothetical protein
MSETIQNTPQEEVQVPAAEQPSLQLADMVLMLKIIQAVAPRGAIRAEEMAEVGALHNKLLAFLTATGAIQPTTTQENQNG